MTDEERQKFHTQNIVFGLVITFVGSIVAATLILLAATNT